ncbi:MAG: spore germination protein [Oscillospiraceae bacterium]|nr:spore germination protein [Oscillospiraceae bacterium]
MVTTATTQTTRARLEEIFLECGDALFTDIYINSNRNLPATVAYVEGMANTQMVSEVLLKPLNQADVLSRAKSSAEIIELINHGTVYHASQEVKTDVAEVATDLLNGHVALMFDDTSDMVIFEMKGFQLRGISPPIDENVIKGGKDAFTEALRMNTGLIRRRIRDPRLKILQKSIGNVTRTDVAILYLDGTTDKKMLQQVLDRIDSINIDDITSTACVEEQLGDNKYSIFPQVLYTERPDKLCANLAEGKIGLIIDGFPYVYMVPVVFNMFFQAPEDYSHNYFVGSLIRILRYVCIFITIILPALYVAVGTFHHEMIPTQLAISIIRSKQEVPLTVFMEVLFMLLAFEVMIESGIRLPNTIGAAVSIVGGLIVGEAAMVSGLISPVVVVVIAIAAICGFIIPSQDMANSFRIVRFVFVIIAEIAGLFGMAIGFAMLIYYFCSIKTFNVPYMMPYVANEGKKIAQDTVLRLPIFKRTKR